MMRVNRVVPTLLLFFLLGGQLTLLPGHAFAWCCGCSCMWWMGCTCSGYWDSDSNNFCYYCRSADPVLQTKASIDKSAEQLKPANESVPSTVAKSDVTALVMELMSGGKCFRDKVALSLLGDNRYGLKFEPVRFDEKNAQDQTLAFKIDDDK